MKKITKVFAIALLVASMASVGKVNCGFERIKQAWKSPAADNFLKGGLAQGTIYRLDGYGKTQRYNKFNNLVFPENEGKGTFIRKYIIKKDKKVVYDTEQQHNVTVDGKDNGEPIKIEDFDKVPPHQCLIKKTWCGGRYIEEFGKSRYLHRNIAAPLQYTVYIAGIVAMVATVKKVYNKIKTIKERRAAEKNTDTV